MTTLVHKVADSIRNEFYKGGPAFGEPEAKAAICALVEWIKTEVDIPNKLDMIQIILSELE